ncbi:2-C-methyl-D-erythritol 4-phosphate cytidylyltransferase [Sphingobacterium griseoflavum]|uniref:2-C-methyl-D-erythritol 4-phosphate cytidylyltransferase n=1 Tax=Sphingobacterium griseoflavum TaxID=1474952 RepID=A0ABQ3HVG6_9SPHI|nr:2-C-methyl-D-erythritol 4-phosphate cytidylyltransferase [Sphingobacterium griseoflavum]GHE29003.1 2-C-methyl-D-erythritol 4-phosphate cytidylyltransferase [Sphingobacterium griseoflavum]
MTRDLGYIIILAAGSGSRFSTALSKQFMELQGKPIVVRTIEKYLKHFSANKIRVVIAEKHRVIWDKITDFFPHLKPIITAYGGSERFYSVRNALETISCSEKELIGVHDAVRPFVSDEVIQRVYQIAQAQGCCVPIFNSVNTLRLVHSDGNETIDRSSVKEVQNPQVFRNALLRNAYMQPYEKRFHDDATLVENLGYKIYTCNGNYENIKITYPQDLYLAEGLMKWFENKNNEISNIQDYKAIHVH